MCIILLAENKLLTKDILKKAENLEDNSNSVKLSYILLISTIYLMTFYLKINIFSYQNLKRSTSALQSLHYYSKIFFFFCSKIFSIWNYEPISSTAFFLPNGMYLLPAYRYTHRWQQVHCPDLSHSI